MRFIHLLMLSSLGLGLISCGQVKEEGDSSDTLRLGEALKAASKLDATQLALGTDVCLALKDKRLNFPTTYFGHLFKFDVYEQSCTQPQYSLNKISAQLVADQFASAYTGQYHKSLETDISGSLASVCASIFSGVTPLDTEALAVDSVRQLSFLKSTQTEVKVRLLYAKKADANSPYLTYKQDEFLVAFPSGISFRGMINERQTTEVCPSGSLLAQSYFKTVFTP